jgi:N-acetylglutamate synthase-like GNAT family acetyltransferase
MCMGFDWIRENPARWDHGKARIVGGTAAGVFDERYRKCADGDLVPAEWWRVEEGGRVIGYGWLDVSWGDAEVLLATDVEHRTRGVGTFILDRLEEEARKRGLNYLYNVVRPTHPRGDDVRAWLSKRGFSVSQDGRLARSVIRASQMPRAHAGPA